MEGILFEIRRLFASFVDSMRALVDSEITEADLKGLMWIAVITFVILVISWLSRALANRRPMGR